MFKWISAIGFSSALIYHNSYSIINSQFFTNSVQSLSFDMTEVLSYDCDWSMSNVTNYDTDVHTVDTPRDTDKSTSNHYRPISDVCVDAIDSSEFEDVYFSLTNAMGDLDCAYNNEKEKELREKIIKHKKSSSFGFSALQKRIERVKNDLINLTNKLNTSYTNDTNGSSSNCYYNLALGNIVDDDEETEGEIKKVEKTWKCPSQFNSTFNFSDLSENSQGGLNFKDEVDSSEGVGNDKIDLEEDELEFTFTNRESVLLRTFATKGTLSMIEEQDEEDSGTDEDSESCGRSTVIERQFRSTPQSGSLHSFDITDSDSYVTPMSSFRLAEHLAESNDDTEEYFSDFAKCSVSSHSSRESLQSQVVDAMEMSLGETATIMAENYLEQISEQERSSSSTKDDEECASEAEYDNSAWSTEDIQQSVEQSDSLYEEPLRSMLKSSLPDLLESSDSYDTEPRGGALVTRYYNKSTDLDEIFEQLSPYHPSSDRRLSQSLCNLFTIKSNNSIQPEEFFQGRASFDNLLETDLDSGYISIYKPVIETEILPKVDLSCSMGNVNRVERSFSALCGPLIDRLRQKAGSVSELRVADSLTKLNIPDWLNLRSNNDERDIRCGTESSSHSLTIPRPSTASHKGLLSSQRRLRTLPRYLSANSSTPLVTPKEPSPVVLPSQLLRQASQRRLMPIKFCQARQHLLPSKVGLANGREH